MTSLIEFLLTECKYFLYVGKQVNIAKHLNAWLSHDYLFLFFPKVFKYTHVYTSDLGFDGQDFQGSISMFKDWL